MDGTLVSLTPESVVRIGLGHAAWLHADMLVAISQATHGDRDVSAYEGFEPLVVGFGEETHGSILRPRFAALLRRTSDGAVRMIRHWAHDGFMEQDLMVADGDRWTIEAAFATHDAATRDQASLLCHADERTEATAADVRAHDAAALREIAWQARRLSRRMMTPSLEATTADMARDVEPPRDGPLRAPGGRQAWFAGFGGEPWYVGYRPIIGREHACNVHHLKALAARLDEGGDAEAASTLRWLGWRNDLDANRNRFLADEATRIQERRVEALEAALRAVLDLRPTTHHWTDSTMRQNPTECFSVYAVGEIVREALEASRQDGLSYAAFSGRIERTPKAVDRGEKA
jgi:hypothetical protein